MGKRENLLQSSKMLNQPTPKELLETIFCNCKSESGVACSCRKLGFFWNATYVTGNGDNCMNCPPIIDDEEEQEDI